MDSIRQGRLADGGPWYHETDLDHFIVEPWNAWSSMTFLIPAILFLIKLRGEYKKHAFISFLAVPLLILGGMGSTLYHAFRSSQAFLLLDFLPIALLTLSVSIYFLWRITRKAWLVAAIVLATFGLRFLIWGRVEGHAAINISYFITGSMIFIPAIIFMVRTKFFALRTLLLSIASFALALYFRFADEMAEPLLPMGTHWLWHIFCAFGAWYLGLYLYQTHSVQATQKQEFIAQ